MTDRDIAALKNFKTDGKVPKFLSHLAELLYLKDVPPGEPFFSDNDVLNGLKAAFSEFMEFEDAQERLTFPALKNLMLNFAWHDDGEFRRLRGEICRIRNKLVSSLAEVARQEMVVRLYERMTAKNKPKAA